jgi:hypothetical protein
MICTAHFGGFFLHSVGDGQLDAEENRHRRNALTDILMRLPKQSLELVTVFIEANEYVKLFFSSTKQPTNL